MCRKFHHKWQKIRGCFSCIVIKVVVLKSSNCFVYPFKNSFILIKSPPYPLTRLLYYNINIEIVCYIILAINIILFMCSINTTLATAEDISFYKFNPLYFNFCIGGFLLSIIVFVSCLFVVVFNTFIIPFERL